MAANALHRVYRGEYCTQEMGRWIEFNLNIHLLLVVRMTVVGTHCLQDCTVAGGEGPPLLVLGRLAGPGPP